MGKNLTHSYTKFLSGNWGLRRDALTANAGSAPGAIKLDVTTNSNVGTLTSSVSGVLNSNSACTIYFTNNKMFDDRFGCFWNVNGSNNIINVNNSIKTTGSLTAILVTSTTANIALSALSLDFRVECE